MADPKHEDQDTIKQDPEAEKKDDLSEKDLEKAAGGVFLPWHRWFK